MASARVRRRHRQPRDRLHILVVAHGGSRGTPAMPPSNLSTGLGSPSRQTILHGPMGIWQLYGTYQTNIRVGLLNLLSPDAFSGVIIVKNALEATGLRLGPCWERLQCSTGL